MAAKVQSPFPDIKGFQENTLIDWVGKIASIVFVSGCNLRCPFCHSSGLVKNTGKLQSISFNNICDFLKSKKGWVDGVVITGGEPTLDEERLFNLIKAIKETRLLVKLDTNGTRPATIKKLIHSHMIDYIAMDIKAPLEKERYEKAAGVKVNIDDVKLSKDLILDSGIDYEFRTTVVPGLIGLPELMDIARSIPNAKRYCLQQFAPRDTLNSAFLDIKPYPKEEIQRMASIASEHLPNVVVKNS